MVGLHRRFAMEYNALESGLVLEVLERLSLDSLSFSWVRCVTQLCKGHTQGNGFSFCMLATLLTNLKGSVDSFRTNISGTLVAPQPIAKARVWLIVSACKTEADTRMLAL